MDQFLPVLQLLGSKSPESSPCFPCCYPGIREGLFWKWIPLHNEINDPFCIHLNIYLPLGDLLSLQTEPFPQKEGSIEEVGYPAFFDYLEGIPLQLLRWWG